MKIKANCPSDFNEKWSVWLEELANTPYNFDIVYQKEKDFGTEMGFLYQSVNDTKVYAKLYLNAQSNSNMPTIAYYHGFGGDIEEDYYIWLSEQWVKQGFNVITMSARNQGRCSKDSHPYHYQEYGVMCSDIDHLETYYSKLIYLDAIRLVNMIYDSNHPMFDKLINNKVVAMGPSQGGILSLVVSTFAKNVSLCVSDVPSGCCLIERVEGSYGMYHVVNKLLNDHQELKELVYHNLGYFDFVNMVTHFHVPLYSAVGTIDNICPCEFFIEAYNKITSPKELIKYEGFGHGGFEEQHFPKKVAFIKNNYK